MNLMYLLMAMAAAGAINALYIAHSVSTKSKLVCYIGDHNCSSVVTSRYSTMFGIKNTTLGVILYVAMIAIALYEIFIAGMPLMIPSTEVILLTAPFLATAVPVFTQAIAITATIVSIYLTYIQMYRLKTMCMYCMFSAIVNLAMLTIVITYYN